MRVLITGGAGFLGLHTARGFAERGYDVRLLDIAPVDLSEYPPGTEYVRGDVRDRDTVERAMEGVDVVIHAAAALPLWDPEEIWDVNVNGTRTVLDVALKKGVERVVFISSTAVYGIPEGDRAEREEDPLRGVGPYGESKIAAERVCQEYREKGLIVPILRPKTFIGPERLGIFSILFDWIKDGARIPIIGDGNNKYQLLDVEDLVDAELLMVEGDEELVNDVYNVGAERFGTWNEDLGALIEHAGTGSKILHLPAGPTKFILKLLEKLRLSPMYEWAYGTADKNHYVSIEKIVRTFNWHPRYSNAESLIRTYDWFIEHYDELKNKEGVTHRVMWKQGILSIVKRLMMLRYPF